MKNRGTNWWIALFLLPTILVLGFFYVIPIVTVVATGFTDWDSFGSPTFSGLKNYVLLMTYDNTFLIAMRNLLLWSLIAATFHVGFGTLVAFIFHKGYTGWRFVRAVFMIPMVISAAAWAMIYKIIFNDDIGVINDPFCTCSRLPGFSCEMVFRDASRIICGRIHMAVLCRLCNIDRL